MGIMTISMISGAGTAQSTVAGLPAANSVPAGTEYVVTNALTPVSLVAVVGGGAVVVKVYSNGSAWIVL